MSLKKILSKIIINSKKTKKILNTKMTYPIKPYHIIENHSLNISLLSKYNNSQNKYIPDEYITFLKKCYKINNTIFSYEIINNILPNDSYVYLALDDYICKNSQIYIKDYKGRKTNFITNSSNNIPYIEDDYNDNRYAITILYFHNVPEEIGKLEVIFYTKDKKKGWKQNIYGTKYIENGRHIIKNGTVLIINANTSYKFTVENKLKNEYKIPVINFSGSIQYPLPKYYNK